MNTNKLAYLLALGVLAFGLTSEYQKGNFPAIHRVLGIAGGSLCRLVTRGEQTLAVAGVLTGRQPQEFDVDDQFLARQQAEVERVMAEHQAEIERALAEHQTDLDRSTAGRRADLACLRQHLDRMHIVLGRAQFQRARALERMRVRLSDAANRRMIVVCPRTGARITVQGGPDLSELPTDLPNIEVGDSF
jgi:hypothetical protein